MLETSNIKIYYNSTVIKLLKNETSNKIYGLKYKKDNSDLLYIAKRLYYHLVDMAMTLENMGYLMNMYLNS